MKDDLPIKNTITIPAHELEIATSRAGGPGGQHVNKASTRITVRWNVKNSQALTQGQKERVMQKLQSRITEEGDILVHNSSTRSQVQNKKLALSNLAKLIRNALHVPKKRMKTRVSKAAKEARLKEKARRAEIKKLRKKKIPDE